ncbi:9817_t:CDS:1, partial [Dentiscutata heterogama]
MSLSKIISLILSIGSATISLILSIEKCILNKTLKKDDIQTMDIGDKLLDGSFNNQTLHYIK